jgi:hypothetical protein
MTDKDQDFAKKITTYLDQGTATLKSGTAYRLQAARTEALARLADPQRSTVPQLALAGGSGTWGGPRRSLWHSGRLWLGIAVIVAATLGFQQWQAYQQANDIEETDTAILSSDLPLDAYLDRGFQAWLKTSADN